MKITVNAKGVGIPIAIFDKDGKRIIGKDGQPAVVVLKPNELKDGKGVARRYPTINPKVKAVAEQLRVHRKHGAIDFSELLQSDVEVLKKAPKGLSPEAKTAWLKKETGLKQDPKKVAPPEPKPAKPKTSVAGSAKTSPKSK